MTGARVALGRDALAAALVAVVAWAAYAQTLSFGFVYDDHVQIEQNPWLRDEGALRLFFTRPLWGFRGEETASNYYRPLFGAAYMAQARAFGLRPVAFHAGSVLLHVLASLVALLGARRLTGNAGAALLGGLLFALHPVHVESVAWVAAQVDPLCALFAFPALLIFLEGWPGAGATVAARATRWVLGPAAYLAACLTKETGLALIGVLAVAALTEGKRDGAALRWLWMARRLAPYAVALGVYVVARHGALGGLAPRDYGVTASTGEAVRLGLSLLGRYLLLLVWPSPAHVLASVPVPATILDAWVACAVVMILGLGILGWVGRRQPAVPVSCAVVLAFLAPALLVDRVGGVNFAERYLYLPSVGLCWLLALGAARLRGARARAAAWAAALTVAILFAAATRRRAEAFRNDRAYFEAAVRTSPASLIARNNLGAALVSAREFAAAEEQYREALRIQPASLDVWTNLGVVREGRGDVAGALQAYRNVLRLAPLHPVAALRTARLERSAGRRDAAAERLDRLLAAGVETYDVLLERAIVDLERGDAARALAALDRAVQLFPESPRGFYLLGQARYRLGDLAGAEAAASEAIRRGAGPGPRRLLALVFLARGDAAGARRWLQEALRVWPGDEGARALLGRIADGAGPGDIMPPTEDAAAAPR